MPGRIGNQRSCRVQRSGGGSRPDHGTGVCTAWNTGASDLAGDADDQRLRISARGSARNAAVVHHHRYETDSCVPQNLSCAQSSMAAWSAETRTVRAGTGTASGNTAPTQCPRDLLHDQRNRRRIVLRLIPPFFRRWDSYFPPQVHTVYYPKV